MPLAALGTALRRESGQRALQGTGYRIRERALQGCALGARDESTLRAARMGMGLRLPALLPGTEEVLYGDSYERHPGASITGEGAAMEAAAHDP